MIFFAGRALALSFALVLFLTAGAVLQPRQALGKDPVNLVTGADYAPYTSPDLPEGGVISELVGLVFTEAGYHSHRNFYPWKRGYNRVLESLSDATFPYARSEERAALFLYSRPINKVTIRVFLRQDSPVRYEAPENMAGKIYCQPLGYQTEPEFNSMIDQGKLQRHEGKDMETCFRLLALKRVDFVVSNDLVAWASARRALGDKTDDIVRAAEVPVREIFEYLIVSRKNPRGQELIDAFNDAYGRLLADGRLAKLWQTRLGKHAHPVQ